MSEWTDKQAFSRYCAAAKEAVVGDLTQEARVIGRALLTLEAARDEAVRAKSALEVASGHALLAVIERAEKAEAEVARLTAVVNETDKSRLYVGSTSRLITAMVERVALAGESPDAVVADYRWEWDRGPDLQPIADLLAEVARMRAVVEAAQAWRGETPWRVSGPQPASDDLATAVDAYRASAQVAE